MPTGRRTWRTWVTVAIAVFILAAIWLPHTSIPAKSKEAIGKAWGHVTGSGTTAASSTTHDAASTTNDAASTTDDAASITADAPNGLDLKEGEHTDDDGMVQMAWANKNETGYDFDKWFYQFDIEEIEHPKYDVEKLKHFAPHNYKGPGHPAFATFFATRSPSIFDPYFMSTVQNVYRLLWDPRSRSNQYPMIVFVAPFVTQEQRDIFAAGGAIVRELDLVPFHPEHHEDGGVAGRLMDMFSKLEMWKQTDFSLINYMDSDAFALENIDRIFDLAPEQRCKAELLAPEDQANENKMCDYVFAGHVERPGMVNAGVIVLKPNLVMHDMLIRESHNATNFDQGMMEQSFLNYIFRPNGPFPPTGIDGAWNGFPDRPEKGEDLYIVHAKLWVPMVGPDHWHYSAWRDTWADMKELYETEDFVRLRQEDERVFNEL